MSHVVDMHRWAEDRLVSGMTDAERWGFERGADVWVSCRTGAFDGWLRDAPDDLARRVMFYVDGLEQIGVDELVAKFHYDDKSQTEFSVVLSQGMLSCMEPGERKRIERYVASDEWREIVFPDLSVMLVSFSINQDGWGAK